MNENSASSAQRHRIRFSGMLKRKRKREMADEYEIDRSTFYRQLKRANIELEPGWFISVEKQIEIYNILGIPNCYVDFNL